MKSSNTQFAVFGLGRFGISVVQTLANLDVHVLACDTDAAQVREVADYATVAVQADVTDEGAMRKLGIGNFDVVILGMAEDFEASVIATMLVKELGAKQVVVKARGLRQKQILEKIGADSVILPEHEMGVRLAQRLARPNVLDVLEDSEHYTISEMKPYDEWVGKEVRDSNIREKHGITILALQRGQQMIIPVSPHQVLKAEDVLITLSEHTKTEP